MIFGILFYILIGFLIAGFTVRIDENPRRLPMFFAVILGYPLIILTLGTYLIYILAEISKEKDVWK